jgi:DNA-binding NarL/FixJ family response regulator
LNLLIIGPNRSFLLSVAAWVNRTGLVERVHTAADAKEALRLAGIVAPEVIVLDAALPNSDWRRLSAELKARSPASRVLLLSGASPAELKGQRRTAEVDGYLSRNDFAHRFRRLLRAYADR